VTRDCTDTNAGKEYMNYECNYLKGGGKRDSGSRKIARFVVLTAVIDEDTSLCEPYLVVPSTGKYSRTFRKTVVPFSSGSKSTLLGLLDAKVKGNMLLRNVGIYSPIDTAQYPRRLKSSMKTLLECARMYAL
jgi:hypothetical protein